MHGKSNIKFYALFGALKSVRAAYWSYLPFRLCTWKKKLEKFWTVFLEIRELYDYSPGQALTAPEVEAPRISRQSAPEGNKVLSPAYRPPYLQETSLVLYYQQQHLKYLFNLARHLLQVHEDDMIVSKHVGVW